MQILAFALWQEVLLRGPLEACRLHRHMSEFEGVAEKISSPEFFAV
jgi:hypothetical protein